MADYLEVESAAGTTLAITTTKPDTHDASGFGDITSGDWDTIGQITAIEGDMKAIRAFSSIPTLDGKELIQFGNESMEQITVTTAFKDSDAGQDTVESNDDGKTICWFRMQFPLRTGQTTPYIRYFAAVVTGYDASPTAVDGYLAASFIMQPIFDTSGVGYVNAPAT